MGNLSKISELGSNPRLEEGVYDVFMGVRSKYGDIGKKLSSEIIKSLDKGFRVEYNEENGVIKELKFIVGNKVVDLLQYSGNCPVKFGENNEYNPNKHMGKEHISIKKEFIERPLDFLLIFLHECGHKEDYLQLGFKRLGEEFLGNICTLITLMLNATGSKYYDRMKNKALDLDGGLKKEIIANERAYVKAEEILAQAGITLTEKEKRKFNSILWAYFLNRLARVNNLHEDLSKVNQAFNNFNQIFFYENTAPITTGVLATGLFSLITNSPVGPALGIGVAVAFGTWIHRKIGPYIDKIA